MKIRISNIVAEEYIYSWSARRKEDEREQKNKRKIRPYPSHWQMELVFKILGAAYVNGGIELSRELDGGKIASV